MISDNQRNEISIHAIDAYPFEACGLLLRNGEYIKVDNIHDEPDNNFCISFEDFLKYEKDVICIFHSHVDKSASPSKIDMEQQLKFDIPWCIVATDGKNVSEPSFFGWNVFHMNYIGLPFLHGVHDCYSLIRHWYLFNKKIILPEYPRDPDWWTNDKKDTGLSMYFDNTEDAGFRSVSVDVNNLEIGDMVLMRMGRTYTANHGGVYIGNHQIAHHVYNRLSTIAPLQSYIDKIEGVLRYEGPSESTRDFETFRDCIVYL